MACFYDSGGSTSNPPGLKLADDSNTSDDVTNDAYVAADGNDEDDDDEICIVYETMANNRLQRMPEGFVILSSPSSQSDRDEKMDKLKDYITLSSPSCHSERDEQMDESNSCNIILNPNAKINTDEEKNDSEDCLVLPETEIQRDDNDSQNESKDLKFPNITSENKEEEKKKDEAKKKDEEKKKDKELQDCIILLPRIKIPVPDEDLCIVKEPLPKQKIANMEAVKKTLSEVNFLKQKQKTMKKSAKKAGGSKLTNTTEALDSSSNKSASTNKKVTNTVGETESSKKNKVNQTHLCLSAKALASLKFPDYTTRKKRRIMPKSEIGAGNSSEMSSMNVTCPSADNVGANFIKTEEVHTLTRCVLRHLNKQSTFYGSAAKQTVSSLHLLLQSTDIPDEIKKEKKDMYTEEQAGNCHKDGDNEKQNLVAYLHSVVQDCSHPEKSQEKYNCSFNQCIMRLTCFLNALEWLYENTQSNMKPDSLMNLKNTIKGLKITIKHLDTLQKQDEKDDNFCSVDDAVQFQLDFDNSLKESTNVVSTGNEKSSVAKTGSRLFLARLYASWNSQSRISSNSESNQNVSVCNDNDTKFSVEPKPPESFSSYMLSDEDYNISNDDAKSSSSDETDRLIISSLSENSESLVSSKECANHSDILNIKDHNMSTTTDDTDKNLTEETNHPLLPESSSSKTDTTKFSVLNTLGSSVDCLLANAALSKEEEVKHDDLVLPCNNAETDEAQMTCEPASISAAVNTAESNVAVEESTVSGKNSSLSQSPCKTRSSKRSQRKHSVWRVARPSDEIDEDNPPSDGCQTRSQAMKKGNESLKMKIHKVPDTEINSSTEDTYSRHHERNSRKRKRKSSQVKVSHKNDVFNPTSESTGKESSSLPSVQQAPLVSRLWKKHAMPHKNTSQDSEAQTSSGTISQNETSLINAQPESHAPDSCINNECQEKTNNVNELQLPLDLSPKQSLEVNSGISQSSVRSPVLNNTTEKTKTILESIVRNQNENQTEDMLLPIKSQFYDSPSTSVSPKDNYFLSSCQSLTRAPPVKETEISNSQSGQPVISVQNTFSVNQHSSLQPFTTAVARYREPPNRNDTNDQSNNLSLANENALVQCCDSQQFAYLQQRGVPRNDATAYDHGALSGVHVLPNNTNILSQNGIQGMSHLGQFVHPPILPNICNGIQIPNSGLAEQVPGGFNSRKAPDMMGNSGNLSSNGTLVPVNLGPQFYGGQSHEMCTSRAPDRLGSANPEPHNLGSRLDMAISNGTLTPRSLESLSYGRQMHEMYASRAPDMSVIPTAGQAPHIMGAMLATANGTHIGGNELVPFYGRQRPEISASRAPDMMGTAEGGQALHMGAMLAMAATNGTHIGGNELVPYGRQRPEISASRAPDMMGTAEGGQALHMGAMLAMATTNGTHIGGNALIPSYGRQRPDICAPRAPDMMGTARGGQAPHIMGAMPATTATNGTLIPGNEVLPSCERYMHEMEVSSARQVSGNMHHRQRHNFAVYNNERQMPRNIIGPSQNNRRQSQPAERTPPKGRKRSERVTGASNVGQMFDELMETQRVTIPNAGHIPGNMMNINAGSINMGYRNVCSPSQFPVQQFNRISAEGAHAPYNYFDGEAGEQRQALQRPLPTGQISPFNMTNLSPPNWYNQPHSLPHNQEQMHFPQPHATNYLRNNRRNQASGNSRKKQARN